MKALWKKFLYWLEYPHKSKDGVRFNIHGNGVIKADMETIIQTDSAKRQIEACKTVRTYE